MFYFSAKPEERCLTHIIDRLEASYGARPRAVTWISTDFRGKTQCATAEVLEHCLKERLLLEALGVFFHFLSLYLPPVCYVLLYSEVRGEDSLAFRQASLSRHWERPFTSAVCVMGRKVCLQVSVQTNLETRPYCRSFVVEAERRHRQVELHASSMVFQAAEVIKCGQYIWNSKSWQRCNWWFDDL